MLRFYISKLCRGNVCRLPAGLSLRSKLIDINIPLEKGNVTDKNLCSRNLLVEDKIVIANFIIISIISDNYIFL